jgi:hypothetical protein
MLVLLIIGITIFMLLTGRIQFTLGVGSVQGRESRGEPTTVRHEVGNGFLLGAATPQPEAAYFPGGIEYTPAIGSDSEYEEVNFPQ